MNAHTANDATRQGDALADITVLALMGDRPLPLAMARLAQANRIMAGWVSNGALDADRWPREGVDDDVRKAMAHFVQEGQRLPDWADPAKIEAAEDLFMAYGPLSCTLLFCGSLPACYQMPQLAEVLHLSGQLEQFTDHRIRQTAAMIFPVMMRGGLQSSEGGGRSQILKVRLIHATIRHLILHRQADEVETLRDERMKAWCRHTWDQARLGMPCSQWELAFTLLTFHYVFLRAMRTLHMGLSPEQESAYLHAWNVVGHVLGIDASLMAHDMQTASQLLQQMEATTGDSGGPDDPRPALGQALVQALAHTIRIPAVRYLPVQMIEHLLGRSAAQRIGLGPQAGIATRLLFMVCLGTLRFIDTVGRLWAPDFSVTRTFTRVLGYRLLTRLLLDQTRPLALPDGLLQQMHATVAAWHTDHQAPAWLNGLEDRLTQAGPWSAPARTPNPSP